MTHTVRVEVLVTFESEEAAEAVRTVAAEMENIAECHRAVRSAVVQYLTHIY